MSETARELFEAVLALPEPDRLGLIDRLARTVLTANQATDADWARAWCEELDRVVEVTRQEVPVMEWDEVRSRLRAIRTP